MTRDGLVVLASEVGVLDIDPADVVRKGRLQPGRIFLADTGSRPHPRGRGRQVRAGRRAPVRGLAARRAAAPRRPAGPGARRCHGSEELTTQQQLFGYTEEELRILLGPMARAGAEPIGSMGTDTPVAALSDRPAAGVRLLHASCSRRSPTRRWTRSGKSWSPRWRSATGPEHNLFDPGPASCRQIVLPYPVISDNDLAKIIHINDDGDLPGFAAHVVDGRYQVAGGGAALRARLAEICAEVSAGHRRRRADHRAVRPRRLC